MQEAARARAGSTGARVPRDSGLESKPWSSIQEPLEVKPEKVKAPEPSARNATTLIAISACVTW